MKKVLLTLLAVIVIVGALAGAGFVGYRIGYNRAAIASGNTQFFSHSERVNPHLMPGFNGENNFRMQPYRYSMMRRGFIGFNGFSLFHILWNIVILALIVWFVYWLFTKSGWRITRQTNEPEVVETKTEGN